MTGFETPAKGQRNPRPDEEAEKARAGCQPRAVLTTQSLLSHYRARPVGPLPRVEKASG